MRNPQEQRAHNDVFFITANYDSWAHGKVIELLEYFVERGVVRKYEDGHDNRQAERLTGADVIPLVPRSPRRSLLSEGELQNVIRVFRKLRQWDNELKEKNRVCTVVDAR